MRIRNSIMTLVVIFTLISCFCYGQGWATIDARLLMILHPRMGNFDYSAGRFFRQSFSTQRNAKLYEALNKATMETERNMAVLIRKEQVLIDKRADLLIERDTTINDLAEKAASSTYIMKGKYERVAEYEKRYEKKMQALDSELEALYAQMENAREQAYSPVYLTKMETTNLLIEIKREIKQLTQEVASAYKIGVVMDSSFGFRPAKRESKDSTVFMESEDFDVLSSSLFHDLISLKVDMPPNVNEKGATPEHVALGSAFGKQDILKKVMQLRSYLTPFAMEYTPGSIFIVGGNDITAYVAQKIFDRYQIPQTLKNSYLAVVRDFLNIEKSSYQESPPKYPNEVYEGVNNGN